MGPKTRLRANHSRKERKILNCVSPKDQTDNRDTRKIQKILPAKAFGDLSAEEANILWNTAPSGR